MYRYKTPGGTGPRGGVRRRHFVSERGMFPRHMQYVVRETIDGKHDDILLRMRQSLTPDEREVIRQRTFSMLKHCNPNEDELRTFKEKLELDVRAERLGRSDVRTREVAFYITQTLGKFAVPLEGCRTCKLSELITHSPRPSVRRLVGVFL